MQSDGKNENEAFESLDNEPPSKEFIAAISKKNEFYKFLSRLEKEGELGVDYNNWSDNEEFEQAGQDSPALSQELVENGDTPYTENVDMTDIKYILDNFPSVAKIMQNKMHILNEKLKKYCAEIPVLGFNSAKYDLNLIHSELASVLDICNNKKGFVIKKNNAYMCITNGRLRFLDITQYLPPGKSYAQFLQSFKIAEHKGFFFYEWLDSEDKLNETLLPTAEAFYSSLKKCSILEMERLQFDKMIEKGYSISNVLKHIKLTEIQKSLEENYEICKQVWSDNKMETIADYLCYYNNIDVSGFVKAIEKLQVFLF